MIRWFVPVAVAIGLLLGLVSNSALGHQTGATLAVSLTPPTLSSGSSANLNCGWHSACVSPWNSGYGLDWEAGAGYGNPWYFRGFFYASDSNRTPFRMFPLVTNSSPDTCDVMTVWIAEIHSGALMAIPTYTHVNITNNFSFDWSGGPWTVYHDRHIGDTINDTGSLCAFNGAHVHEAHSDYLVGTVTNTRNRSVDGGVYVDAATCHNLACGTYRTDDIYKWTNHWQWAEGIIAH